MKKLFAIVVLCFSLSGLFASYDVQSNLAFPFERYDIRKDAMGGSGLALKKTGGPESEGFSLFLPSVGVRLYNIKNNISSFEAAKSGDAVAVALGFLNSIPAGFKDFMTVDAGVGMSLSPLSFYFNSRLSVMTAGPGNASSSMFIMYEESYDISLSHTFHFNKDWGVSLSFSFRPSYRLYSADSQSLSGVNVSDVSNIVASSTDSPDIMASLRTLILDDVPFSSGWALPICIYSRLDMPYGFSTALALNNLNGNYEMAYRGGLLAARGKESGAVDEVRYTVDVPFSLDLGLSWSGFWSGWKKGLADPHIAVDIVDLVGLLSGDLAEKGGLIDHLKLGARLDFLYMFSIAAGLDRGYVSAGFSFLFKVFEVDLTYAVKPYGAVRYGDSLDYLALRVALGWVS